jgi:hypothetical protein
VTAKLTEKPRKTPLPHPARRHLSLPPSAPRFAAPPTARFVPTKTVGSFVPTLTKKAFEKFGFSAATLITDWARIAGTELAQYTMPDKLKWPRGADASGIYEDEGERRGATLILRVDPARALDVEYRARQIMDRINAYFGYRAVETIRLVQAPLSLLHLAEGESSARRGGGREGGNPNGQRSGTPPHEDGGNSAAPDPADDPLLAALARLEQGIRHDRKSRRA